MMGIKADTDFSHGNVRTARYRVRTAAPVRAIVLAEGQKMPYSYDIQ
jgi:hypothetical protein